ncbi:hypothetical protein [Williamsoniiplasma lucivorax]|uniref:Uncharacterized protein n=1 Tax=Williamsoniiplasma lucivorax TaxID=209274 RepID=A0A2S5REW6_9MOLU|nr:hypothetical protein [Williamsoniiplasma lucivorax]PPE05850.1 hypothetical protein ELUCI_v1c01380 [Williamsoniiplasma lucivorax]
MAESIIFVVVALEFALFAIFITWGYGNWKKTLIYDVYKNLIDFSKFPLFFKKAKCKLLIHNFVCFFLTLIAYIMSGYYFFIINKAHAFKNEVIWFFVISSIGWMLYIALTSYFYLKTSKIIASASHVYDICDPELEHKWNQENFKMDISHYQLNEITLIPNAGLRYRSWKKQLNIETKIYNKKILKAKTPNKKIKLFLSYLRIHGLFIWRIEKYGSGWIVINGKTVYIDELKKAVIQNFFYYKNLNKETEAR